MNEKGNRYAIAALKDRRATMAGKIVQMKEGIRCREEQLAHLDVVLCEFDPSYRAESLPPRGYGASSCSGTGKLNRLIADALRRAEKPLASHDIAHAIVTEKGYRRDLIHALTRRTCPICSGRSGSLRPARGSTRPITSSLLSANDNVSSGAQLRYTITTGPAHGNLLLNGAVAASFTQADINNGLVSYQETVNGVTSDTLSFKIADAAGNVTATSSFQVNIGPFDALEYVASNPDLIVAFGLNLTAATDHYFTTGIYEHRATNSFDGMEYIASYPDLIAALGPNAALGEQHYVALGFNEHRVANSFDAMEYIASNPDLITALGPNAMLGEQHYVALGFNEHRSSNSFHAMEYIASNRDLIKAFGPNTALGEQHYVGAGFNEHRVINSFDAAQYIANYPDLFAAFGNNLLAAEQHYVWNGFSEGRTDQKPVITGGGGNDILVAQNGAIMTGGAGVDTFVFNSSLLTSATVTDFAVGSDHLQISASGFGHGLAAGGAAPLVTAATASSTTHVGTDGYFIFDNANMIWWDRTGGSGADAIALAKLTGVASLHSSDFLLA